MYSCRLAKISTQTSRNRKDHARRVLASSRRIATRLDKSSTAGLAWKSKYPLSSVIQGVGKVTRDHLSSILGLNTIADLTNYYKDSCDSDLEMLDWRLQVR